MAYRARALGGGAISVAGVVASLALLPVALARIPADYFCHRHRHRPSGEARHPLVAGTLAVAKNLLGGALVAAGLVMLLTPGQGVIMLLAGLMIANYPGKFARERWLIERPHVSGIVALFHGFPRSHRLCGRSKAKQTRKTEH
jgi:hypothetical protein